MANQSAGFWSSLQGILTGVAAVITAVTGLYIAINSTSSSHTESIAIPPPVVAEPAKPSVISPSENTRVNVSPKVAIQSPQVVHHALPNAAVIAIANEKLDCALFSTKNTARSLMSWSNHYQQKIIDAKGDKARAITPCIKTIGYRAQAYCSDTSNNVIEKALNTTLQHCANVGVSWRDAVTPK